MFDEADELGINARPEPGSPRRAIRGGHIAPQSPTHLDPDGVAVPFIEPVRRAVRGRNVLSDSAIVRDAELKDISAGRRSADGDIGLSRVSAGAWPCDAASGGPTSPATKVETAEAGAAESASVSASALTSKPPRITEIPANGILARRKCLVDSNSQIRRIDR